MATLPTPGASYDSWGQDINTWLSVDHNADGTHPAALARSADLARVDPGWAGSPGDALLRGLTGAVWAQSVINVRAFGVDPNASAAAQTAAIQDIFTKISNGTYWQRVVYFPEGTYELNTYLVPPRDRIAIIGANRDATIITQTAANTPHFRWQDEGSGAGQWLSESIHVRDLRLTHTSAPTASTTQQYGIQFRPSAAGTSVNHKGYSEVYITNVTFEKCFIGLGVWTATGGQCPIWNGAFRDLIFWDTYRHAIFIKSDVGVGSTSMLLERIDVINWNANYGGVVNDNQPAIVLWNCVGFHLDTINIEDWRNNGIEIMFSMSTTVSNIRFEWHRFTVAYSNLIRIDQGVHVINGLTMQNTYTTHSTGWCALLNLTKNGGNPAPKVTANGIRVALAGDNAGTGIVVIGDGSQDTRLVLSSIELDAQWWLIEFLDAAGFGVQAGKWMRTSVDGLPPLVDALPTAGVAWRGRQFRVQGGSGVADVTSECRKLANDTYAWVAL